MDKVEGVALGRLLLALDRTVATLVSAPHGLDTTVVTLTMIDVDDLHYGLGRTARDADLYLLVGLSDGQAVELLAGMGAHRPVAVMAKAPSAGLVEIAGRLGTAVVAIEPHARWERIYNLVIRVLDRGFETRDPAGESMRTGDIGDLFELAAEVARRTRGLISIEDERAHVLAYSAAGDAADELRRLSILGREGPPEMMAWLRHWGVMDELRTSSSVVRVAARPDLGLRSRRAIAIRAPGSGEFLGIVWLQQGDVAPASDTDDVLAGAAAVAARVIARRRAAGSSHDDVVRRLLGARGDLIDADDLGAQLGIGPQVRAVVVGFGVSDPSAASTVMTQIPALTLHASAFSQLSVTTTLGGHAYVVLPGIGVRAAVDWARGVVATGIGQFGTRLRAVVAGPVDGLAGIPELRVGIDRVLDAAEHDADLIDDVTTVEASRTGVLLGEIVGLLSENPELVDARVVELAELDARTGSEFIISLRVHLDCFGDVRTAAAQLHVHPNTLRYRIRRLQELTGMDLDDPATRLVVALSLRAVAPDATHRKA